MSRKVGISEARRLLPELVRTIAAEGGRVDITYRGKAQVSLIRVSDVKRVARLHPSKDPALRVVLNIPEDELIGAIRELRREHRPRAWWLAADDDKPKRPSKRPPKRALVRRRTK